jgi:hypothetical protein
VLIHGKWKLKANKEKHWWIYSIAFCSTLFFSLLTCLKGKKSRLISVCLCAPSLLNTTPWRCRGEWICSSTHS